MKLKTVKIAAAFLLLFAAQNIGAVDFGGYINNNSKMTGSSFSNLYLDQTDQGGVWIRVPFDNASKHYLAAEAFVQYEYLSNSQSSILTADCNLLKYNGLFNLGSIGKLNVQAGRFFMSDATGLVLRQTNDGALLTFKFPYVSANFYGGYTGLLNAQNVTILNSDSSTYSFNANLPYALQAPYVTALASVSSPFLFLNQTLSLQLMGFIGAGQGTTGYNRYYATVKINGPLASFVYYTMDTTFSTQDNFASFSNLSNVSVNFYIPFMSAEIALKGTYASGNNGFLKAFKGFTSITATYAIDEPEYSGLIKGGLSLAMRPLSSIYLGGGANAVFKCPDAEITYGGMEWFANATYQLFADLQLGLSASQYISADGKSDKTNLTVKAVMAF